MSKFINPWPQYLDENGNPYAGGTVFFGQPNQDPVNNPKAPFSDKALQVPIGSSQLLDDKGMFQTAIFLSGLYSVSLFDVDNNFIRTDPEISGEVGGGVLVLTFATLALAVADTGLVDGDSLNIAERTTGNGGGAMWDVVLSSTVTENTFNIVQGTGVATLSLVLRLEGNDDIRKFGAVGDGSTDDTAAFVGAYDATTGFHIPAGTWRIDNFTILKSFKITTDGFNTILHQNSGLVGDIRIIDVDASNVIIEDIKFKGNTTTDTGEQRHGIRIFADTTNGSFSNVTIGNVFGEDLRGDVVYIGGRPPTQAEVTIVKIGNVTASNCYRHAVSITGVQGLEMGVIKDLTLGSGALDIEPDLQGGVVKGVNIAGVEGSGFSILGSSPDDIWGATPHDADYGIDKEITIGYAKMIGSDIPLSVPSLGEDLLGTTLIPRNALTLRNTRGVKIGHFDARNYHREPITTVFSGTDLKCDDIEITNAYFANSCLESGVTYMNMAGTKTIKIENLRYFLTDSSTQFFLTGTAGAIPAEEKTKFIVGKIVGDGPLQSLGYIDCSWSSIEYTDDIACTKFLSGATFRNAAWDVGRLSTGNIGGLTFTSSNLVFSGTNDYDATLGSAYHAIEINTTKNTVYNPRVIDNIATDTITTTTSLADITDAINTAAIKVEGYKVLNATTGIYVVAAGNADGSVWVFEGTGNTAHTPV